MNRFGWLLGVIFILFSACDDYTVEPENLLKVRPLTAEEKMLLSSSNNFSFELLKLLEQQNPTENIFFSSIGIGNGLGMAFHIMDNKSKSSIKNFLNISNVADIDIDRAYFQLSEILNKIDPEILYVSANSYWINQESPIDLGAENRIMAYYEADVQLLNFQNKKSIKYINNWAEDRSFGRVDHIFSELNPEDKSYMVNLLYFDMNHALPFDRVKVSDYYFTSSEGKMKNLPYVNQYGKNMGVFNKEEYKVVDIPLGKGNFTLTLIIPKRGKMLPKLIQEITFEDYSHALANLIDSDEGIILPDLTMDKEVRMKKLFPRMGITDEIKVINYDFIAKNLFISDFVHKASFTFGKTIAVPESKTSNITPVIEGPLLSNPTIVDKSFLFFIREKSINAIIFAGKMNLPETS